MMAAAALEEQYQGTRYRDPDCIVFSHPAVGNRSLQLPGLDSNQQPSG